MIAAKIWERNLASVDDELVSKALDRCVDNFTWPPEVGEFKQLCGTIKSEAARVQWFTSDRRMVNIPVRRLINSGAQLCKRLKAIHADKTWTQLSLIFTALLNAGRKFRPDLNELQLLEFLDTCPDEDLLDLLDNNL